MSCAHTFVFKNKGNNDARITQNKEINSQYAKDKGVLQRIVGKQRYYKRHLTYLTT